MKKCTRKHFADDERGDERADMYFLSVVQDRSSKEVSKLLNRKYGNSRTPRAIKSEVFKIVKGVKPMPKTLQEFIHAEGTLSRSNKNSKSGRTVNPYSEEERGDLYRLGVIEKKDRREVAKLLNQKYGNNRTNRGVQMEIVKIVKGVKPMPKIPEAFITGSVTSVKSEWSVKERERLYEEKIKGSIANEIVEILKKEFGTSRTANGVNTMYSIMRKSESERPDSLKDAEFPRGKTVARRNNTTYSIGEKAGYSEGIQIVGELENFDRKNLRDLLSKRRKVIYGIMSEQAKKVRGYKTLTVHAKTPLAELMKLNEDERQKAIQLLESGSGASDVKDIEILAIPFFRGNSQHTALIVPVYVKDVSTSGDTLESCLDTGVVFALSNKAITTRTGFKQGEPFEDRFENLKRYNVSQVAGADYNKLADEITKTLGNEYSGVGVSIVQDKSLSGFLLGEE